MDSILWLSLLAIPAGIIGFVAAPCCGLLAPAYIPYAVSQMPREGPPQDGTSPPDGSAVAVRTRRLTGQVVRNLAMFVLGFTVVFTALGASATAAGQVLLGNLPLLLNISGVFVVIIGALILVYGGLPWRISGPKTLDPSRLTGSPLGGLAFGVTFALVWTPCLGPTLGAMLVVAAQAERIVTGSALLFLYALGLVIPFILISLGIVGSARISSFIHRRRKIIQAIGGIALIVVGLMIIFGGWQGIMADLTGQLARLGWPPL